jgi:hypothetical protein
MKIIQLIFLYKLALKKEYLSTFTFKFISNIFKDHGFCWLSRVVFYLVFLISSFNIMLIGDWNLICLDLFSVALSRSYNSGCEFDRLIGYCF